MCKIDGKAILPEDFQESKPPPSRHSGCTRALKHWISTYEFEKRTLLSFKKLTSFLSSLRFLENYYAKGNLSATRGLRVPSLVLDFPDGTSYKELPANVEVGSVSGSGRSPGGGNDNPLQYFCPENPMDRGGWQATVHKISKSWTRLSDWTYTHILVLTFCSYTYILYLIIFIWFFPLGVMLFSFLNWLWIFPLILHCSCFLFAFKKVEERKYNKMIISNMCPPSWNIFSGRNICKTYSSLEKWCDSY